MVRNFGVRGFYPADPDTCQKRTGAVCYSRFAVLTNGEQPWVSAPLNLYAKYIRVNRPQSSQFRGLLPLIVPPD